MKKYLCPLGTVLVLALLAAGVYAASSDDSLISLYNELIFMWRSWYSSTSKLHIEIYFVLGKKF